MYYAMPVHWRIVNPKVRNLLITTNEVAANEKTTTEINEFNIYYPALYSSSRIFAYGIYTTAHALAYVKSYQSSAYISDQGQIHYVINSSIIYFGIGLITLIGAVILTTFNRLQKNMYETMLHLNNHISSSYDYNNNYMSDDSHQIKNICR